MFPNLSPFAMRGFVFTLAVLFLLGPGVEAQPQHRLSPKEIQLLKQQILAIEGYVDQGDWWAAERETLKLLDDLKGKMDDDHPSLIQQRIRLAGRIYPGQGRLTEAQDELKKHLALTRVQDGKEYLEPHNLPEVLLLLGIVEKELQDPNAIRRFEEALKLLADRDLSDSEASLLTRKYRGLIRCEQGDYLLGRDDFAAILKSSPKGPPRTILVASVHQSLAVLEVLFAEESREGGKKFEAEGYLLSAEKHLLQAEKYCQTSKPSAGLSELKKLVVPARTLLDRLKDDFRSGTVSRGILRHARFLFSPSQLDPRDREANRMNDAAMDLIESGRFREADLELGRAIALLKSAGPANRRLLNSFLFNQTAIRVVHLEQGPQSARLAGEVIDDLFEIVLDDLAFQSFRQQILTIDWCSDRLRLYLSLAVQAGLPPGEIYSHVYRWKGLLFAANSARRIPNELRQRFARLVRSEAEARTVHARCLESASATTADRSRTWESLEQIQRELAAVRNEHKPGLASGFGSPVELSAALLPGTVFLDYAEFEALDATKEHPDTPQSAHRYLLFVVRAGNPEVTMIPLPKAVGDVNEWIVQWRTNLAEAAADPARETEQHVLASKIAEAIWNPAKPHCEGSRLLWVCPTGGLSGFPFAALPDPELNYLVRRVPIGYAVSARQAFLSRISPRSPASRKALVVSGIRYSGESESLENSDAVANDFARRFEESQVARLTGSAASKAEFLRLLRTSGANVCFIGHGLQSEERKVETAFLSLPPELIESVNPEGRLTGFDQFRIPLAGARRDQLDVRIEPSERECWLFQDELAEAIPLDADRSAFLACASSLGPNLPNEGMISFPRVLLAGGYRHVFASQWNVHTQSALAVIPKRFHAGIFDQGLGDAVALQRAQCAAIDLGDVNASPYHWAAWVVIGDPGSPLDTAMTRPIANGVPPNSESDSGRIWLWLIGGSALLLVVLVRWRMNHRWRRIPKTSGG